MRNDFNLLGTNSLLLIAALLVGTNMLPSMIKGQFKDCVEYLDVSTRINTEDCVQAKETFRSICFDNSCHDGEYQICNF